MRIYIYIHYVQLPLGKCFWMIASVPCFMLVNFSNVGWRLIKWSFKFVYRLSCRVNTIERTVYLLLPYSIVVPCLLFHFWYLNWAVTVHCIRLYSKQFSEYIKVTCYWLLVAIGYWLIYLLVVGCQLTLVALTYPLNCITIKPLTAVYYYTIIFYCYWPVNLS